jgi:SOS regulatory protein LexA
MNKVNKALTPQQKKLLDFIETYYKKYGFSPSLEEMKRHLNVRAVSTVHQHVQALSKKGYIKKENNFPRGSVPLKQNKTFIQVPLMGIVAAGRPIEPIENPEPIDVPISMAKNTKDYYALKVRGDSMINDDVWDGDIILVKHQQTANMGDMVVAVTNGEVTLKRFGGLKDGKVVLIPKNINMAPFYVNPETFEIRGKFAGLIRRG